MLIGLFLVAALGLLLTAIGLPGTWLFLALVSVAKLASPASALGWMAIGIGFGLALLGEAIEWMAGTRAALKYGGSTRAGWGAMFGGLVGALVGVPVPLIGPLVGAVAGTFIGALVAEYSVRGFTGGAERVAWGAMLGRIFAIAVKVGLGFVIALVILLPALFG